MINLFRRYGFNGWSCGLLAVALLTSLALLRLGHTQSGPFELIGRRTLTSKTFRHPDGSLTLKAYAGPIHYYDPTGRLQDLNLSLRSYLLGDYTYLADGMPHRVQHGPNAAGPVRIAQGSDYIIYRLIGGSTPYASE